MTVSPMARPELPEARYGPAYDWDVTATIAGTEYQRACGITDDYDRACSYVVEALEALPPRFGRGRRYLHRVPARLSAGLAHRSRDASGVIAWSLP